MQYTTLYTWTQKDLSIQYNKQTDMLGIIPMSGRILYIKPRDLRQVLSTLEEILRENTP